MDSALREEAALIRIVERICFEPEVERKLCMQRAENLQRK